MDILNTTVPLDELNMRMRKFRARMDVSCPDWEIVVIFSKVNLFYFTGTLQDGMLLIMRNQDAVFWVRRSYERALDESLFPQIKPMASFRDAAADMKKIPETVYLETEVVPLALYQRLQKHFPFRQVRSADLALSASRALKSLWELGWLEKAGEIHRQVMEEDVPGRLREGMNEADLGAELYSLLVARGHQGLVRFAMFDTDVAVGHVAFGESSLYPTSFDGPGGNYGMSASVPWLGSRHRLLKKGDLVYIDIGCGVEGYHTDKTLSYMFGQPLPQEAQDAHRQCVDLQQEIASRLVPGAIPSQIYQTIMKGLAAPFLENFMGYGKRRVKFLGHGIGLVVDEWPAIAEGFDEPLQENMVLAVEPKKGVKDLGMMGTENSYVVTPKGGQSITGNNRGLISVA